MNYSFILNGSNFNVTDNFTGNSHINGKGSDGLYHLNWSKSFVNKTIEATSKMVFSNWCTQLSIKEIREITF